MMYMCIGKWWYTCTYNGWNFVKLGQIYLKRCCSFDKVRFVYDIGVSYFNLFWLCLHTPLLKFMIHWYDGIKILVWKVKIEYIGHIEQYDKTN